MSFEVYGATQASEKQNVNWEALNEYVVKNAGLEEAETIVGYISSIIDLGTQKIPDAEYPFQGNAQDEENEKLKDPKIYFKDGLNPETKIPCRLKCVPQKDQQCVAMSVDFPDIMLDKGQFFGKSNEKPLRLWLGGQFYVKDLGSVVGRLYPLKVTNIDKTKQKKKWSLSQKSMLYEMALAAKIIKNGDCFLPKQIDSLLGQSFQFSAQVFFKKGSDGKLYYTENLKFVGALAKGQKKLETITEPFTIGFYKENSEDDLKQIRSHILNTMKIATNWEGSAVQKQILSLKSNVISENDVDSSEDEEQEEEANLEFEDKKVTKQDNEVEDLDDLEDIFN